MQREKDEAVRGADYERAASLRDEAQQLLEEKAQLQKKWYEQNKETTGVVDAEIIAEVVSNMTGVPADAAGEERDAAVAGARGRAAQDRGLAG